MSTQDEINALLEEKRQLANKPSELSDAERHRLGVINALLGGETPPEFDPEAGSPERKAKAKRLVEEALKRPPLSDEERDLLAEKASRHQHHTGSIQPPHSAGPCPAVLLPAGNFATPCKIHK